MVVTARCLAILVVLGCAPSTSHVASTEVVTSGEETVSNRASGTITLRLAPPVGMRWSLTGRTRFDLGGPVESAMACTTEVTATGAVVGLSTSNCTVASDENAPVAPPAFGGAAIERYDALGRSITTGDSHHMRRGYPVLLTFPERPVAVGDHWAAPPATVSGMSVELMPSTLDHELTELVEGRATVVARGEVMRETVRMQLSITGVIDVATGTYVSYAMELRASEAAPGNGPAFAIEFDFTTAPAR